MGPSDPDSPFTHGAKTRAPASSVGPSASERASVPAAAAKNAWPAACIKEPRTMATVPAPSHRTAAHTCARSGRRRSISRPATQGHIHLGSGPRQGRSEPKRARGTGAEPRTVFADEFHCARPQGSRYADDSRRVSWREGARSRRSPDPGFAAGAPRFAQLLSDPEDARCQRRKRPFSYPCPEGPLPNRLLARRSLAAPQRTRLS